MADEDDTPSEPDPKPAPGHTLGDPDDDLDTEGVDAAWVDTQPDEDVSDDSQEFPEDKPAEPDFAYLHPACQSVAFYLDHKPPPMGAVDRRGIWVIEDDGSLRRMNKGEKLTCNHCGTTLVQLHNRHIQ